MEKSNQNMPKSEYKVSPFPDAIYINNQSNLVAISQYKLLEDNQNYEGGIILFDLSSEGLQQSKDLFFESKFGIFDINWMSPDSIISANENNSLSLFKCADGIKMTDQIPMPSKCIYVDYDSLLNEAYVALSSGEISSIDLTKKHETKREKVHSDYVWMVKKQPQSDLLFSGADDFHLSVFDLKSGESVVR